MIGFSQLNSRHKRFISLAIGFLLGVLIYTFIKTVVTTMIFENGKFVPKEKLNSVEEIVPNSKTNTGNIDIIQ